MKIIVLENFYGIKEFPIFVSNKLQFDNTIYSFVLEDFALICLKKNIIKRKEIPLKFITHKYKKIFIFDEYLKENKEQIDKYLNMNYSWLEMIQIQYLTTYLNLDENTAILNLNLVYDKYLNTN